MAPDQCLLSMNVIGVKSNKMTEEKKLTGYPSVDRPWEKYYPDAVKNYEFPKKTMYRCIYD